MGTVHITATLVGYQGRTRSNALLDTGGERSQITKRIADRIGAATLPPATTRGFGGRLAELPQVAIRAVEYRGRSTSPNAGAISCFIGPEVILGLNVIEPLRIALFPSNRSVSLEDNPGAVRCPECKRVITSVPGPGRYFCSGCLSEVRVKG